MKKLIFIIIFAFTFISVDADAVDTKADHLLDGSSMNYYYQSGRGIHMEFYDGMLKYEWTSGPKKGNSNKDLSYQSRKIGHKMYMVSWLEEAHPDYITLVFNFDSSVIYSSGIARFGSKNQFIVFDGGIIENLELVEK